MLVPVDAGREVEGVASVSAADNTEAVSVGSARCTAARMIDCGSASTAAAYPDAARFPVRARWCR